MVLYRGGDDVFTSQVVYGGIDSGVAAFCAAGGKEDLTGMCVEDAGD